MAIQKFTITANNTKLHLVLGKTREEWEKLYGNESCWDIAFEELMDRTLEIDQDIWYWFIDGRCYETTEKYEN